MFTLYDKRTNAKATIYKVEKNKSGYADFLVRRNGQWWWDSAKHYITEDEYNAKFESRYDEYVNSI